MNSAIGNCFLNVNWSDKHFFGSKVKVSDSQSLSLYIKEFVLFKPVRRAQRNTEICREIFQTENSYRNRCSIIQNASFYYIIRFYMSKLTY